jgi:hypothetical protein
MSLIPYVFAFLLGKTVFLDVVRAVRTNRWLARRNRALLDHRRALLLRTLNQRADSLVGQRGPYR